MVIFGQFDEGGDPPAMARQVQGLRFDLHVGFHLDVVSDRGEQPAVEPDVFALDAARGVRFGDQVAGKIVEEDRRPAAGRFHGPLAQGVVDVFAQDGPVLGCPDQAVVLVVGESPVVDGRGVARRVIGEGLLCRAGDVGQAAGAGFVGVKVDEAVFGFGQPVAGLIVGVADLAVAAGGL